MNKTRRSTKTLGRTAALDTPMRAVQFLRTVGTDSNVAQALANVGFTAADRKHGWDLLCKASTSVDLVRRPAPKADATERLEQWRKAHVVIARAALAHLHPEQSAFVFAPMRADTPTLLSVGKFLDHLDALESSPKRVSKRQADHAALATLDRRGITTQARKTARQLIDAVLHVEVATDQPNDSAKNEARAALLQLHAWLTDWSECARTVIQRRDQLLRLGIGKRQKPKSPTPPGP